MKRLFFISVCIILCLAGSPWRASAQRTADRTVFLGLSQMVSASALPSGGVTLEGGQYLLNSYWKAGVSAVDWNQRYNNPDGTLERAWFDHIHYTLQGGWMYRLASTYSRSFSLYGGASAFLGCNSFNGFRPLPAEYTGGYPRAEFIYGFFPELELEWYPFRRTGFTLSVRSPFTFSSSLETDLWHITGAVGIRINL